MNLHIEGAQHQQGNRDHQAAGDRFRDVVGTQKTYACDQTAT